MNLKKILKGLNYKLIRGNLDKNITDIKYDSRAVKKGDLFIAISGFKKDGHSYINEALKNGAIAVIIEKKVENYNSDITYIKVDNSRKEMALLAKNFFENPLAEINLIGITGTNGKTTTAFLLYNILKNFSGKAALFGTIKNIIGKEEITAKRTTAESIDLFRYFSQMRKKGIKYGVMEVSSHALDLYRVHAVDFKAAIFTNITPEHLDYHKNLKNYLEAKSRLFSSLSKNSFAVINLDDPNSDFIAQKSKGENYFYSLSSEAADLYTKKYHLVKDGINYQTDGVLNCAFDLKLGGIFNIYNSLAAILASKLLGISENIIYESLSELDGVPGRFEIVDAGQDFQIIVDYAHTPDGMKNVLETAVSMKKKRLLVLFGCGGDRDQSKRPMMAQLAEKFGDYIIVSNDNPRSEDPENIFSEIKNGFSANFNKYEIIADRKKAIEKILKIAEKDDLVMILGRGHEKYQVLKNKKIKLDDREAAKTAAKKLLTTRKEKDE